LSCRPYFALPIVLDGMFKLAKRIFGIEITAADGEEDVSLAHRIHS
jgi:oligopeptidase A